MSLLNKLSQVVREHLALANGTISTKWTIDESALGGRGLIATDDINPGEVLFVDHPLVYGPRASAVPQSACTVCCKTKGSNFFKCNLCALLICSNDCYVTEIHKNDCKIISSWNNKIPIQEVDDMCLSRALTPIRALLLNENQKQILSCLQAHASPQHGSEVRQLKEYFEIPEKDMKIMEFACCVLDANAFQIATPYGSDDISTRGLYPVSSLMNHNCMPNTRHSFDKDMRMTIHAVKQIKRGSEIFTYYSGLLWGTPARRHHLYKTKKFVCSCARCVDPTERGTMLAALKCFSSDCPGSLLPIEPLNFSSKWRCIECSMVVPAKHIAAIQSALGSLVGSLDFENAIQLENFLTNRITNYIPRTNQIVVDLQCRLIWSFGEAEELSWKKLSESRLCLKQNICRSILRTVAALGLGDAHIRGLLLYHLHATLAERARRSQVLYEELKHEIETTIEQAYNILQGDISAPPDLELRRQYLGSGCDKTHHERFFILEI